LTCAWCVFQISLK